MKYHNKVGNTTVPSGLQIGHPEYFGVCPHFLQASGSQTSFGHDPKSLITLVL
jgi:hypothetical protein